MPVARIIEHEADRFLDRPAPARLVDNTLRLEFVHVAPAAEKPAPASFDAGQWIDRFAVVSCPNQTEDETAALAQRMGRVGWQVAEEGALALAVGRYLVYSNFSAEMKLVPDGKESVPLAPKTSGWVVRQTQPRPCLIPTASAIRMGVLGGKNGRVTMIYTHCLRLRSIPQMQQTLRAKLWDDVIASMENGSRNRRVGKKIRELIGL